MAEVGIPENSISIESLRYSWCIDLDRSTNTSLRFSLDSLSGYFDLDLDLHNCVVGGGAHSEAPPSSVRADACPKLQGVLKRLIGLILRPLNRLTRGRRMMNSKVGADGDRINRGYYYCDRETQIREAVLHCTQ